MKIFYWLYVFLSLGLFLILSPAAWLYTRITGQYRSHLGERLGSISPEVTQHLSGSILIWIHAASLGEVKVAVSIVNALRNMKSSCAFVLSTNTPHGRKMAEELFSEDIPVIFAPIDFAPLIRRALKTLNPDIMLFIETEIWPAWLFEARRMGIRTALLNGRISARSFGKYMGMRPFFCEVLKNFDVFSMISEEDAKRIIAIGADPQKIEINGNAKYDHLGSGTDPQIETAIRKALNINEFQRVFVAGSTRTGEEGMILDAYEKILEHFRDTILIIVPRHIERTPDIGSIIKARGYKYQTRSALQKGRANRTGQIVIIDTFGELFRIYSIGTIVFCGASLVPLGGQNPLEPAIWGKVVFYGPSMEDFSDAKILLEKVGAGFQVTGPEMLAEKAVWFLDHPDELKARGKLGREEILKNIGAGERHALAVMKLIA